MITGLLYGDIIGGWEIFDATHISSVYFYMSLERVQSMQVLHLYEKPYPVLVCHSQLIVILICNVRCVVIIIPMLGNPADSQYQYC